MLDEPEHILAISMAALLFLGMCAQFMQSRGGRIARLAPVFVLSLLMLISIGGMVALSGSLSATDWQEA